MLCCLVDGGAVKQLDVPYAFNLSPLPLQAPILLRQCCLHPQKVTKQLHSLSLYNLQRAIFPKHSVVFLTQQSLFRPTLCYRHF